MDSRFRGNDGEEEKALDSRLRGNDGKEEKVLDSRLRGNDEIGAKALDSGFRLRRPRNDELKIHGATQTIAAADRSDN